MENFDSIQDLIFIFNLELKIDDNEFLNTEWFRIQAKYLRLKKKWEQEEKQRKEMEERMKQNRSRKR